MQLEAIKYNSDIYNIDEPIPKINLHKQEDLSCIKMYPNLIKSSHTIPLRDIIENNVLLQVIVSIRYASPNNQGFSFPISSPIHIADLLNNSSLLALKSLFSGVNVRADADKELIYGINCGPLKQQIIKQYVALLDTDIIHPNVKAFFSAYNFFDISNCPAQIYKANIENHCKKDESCIFDDPILYYIVWALSLFYNPICEIPYYNRTINEVKNDLILEEIASISKYLYVNGYIINGQWLSRNIIVKQLNPNTVKNFKNWLWH